MSPPTYEAEVACGNCGYSGKVQIIKGNPVESKACPNCGCGGMRRISKSWVFK